MKTALNAGAAFSDFATITVGGVDETTYFEFNVNPALLVSGVNTIAAEVHQVNSTSSDLDFDIEVADVLYYLNAIAINRGKTLEEYAEISYRKVSAKTQINIEGK